MRKHLLTTALAVVAAALMAPAAMALTPPHDDSEADNWTAVEAYDPLLGEPCGQASACDVSSDETGWSWRNTNPSSQLYAQTCQDGEISLTVDAAGNTLLTDAGWFSGSGATLFCQLIGPLDSASGNPSQLTGSICMHVPTGEFWQQQSFGFKTHSNGNTVGYGDSYGRWSGESSEYGTELSFGQGNWTELDITTSGWQPGLEHKADFDFGDTADGLALGGTGNPCSWNGLS